MPMGVSMPVVRVAMDATSIIVIAVIADVSLIDVQTPSYNTINL